MPFAAPLLCARCRQVHTGQCPQRVQDQRDRDQKRGSASQRGYDIHWRRFREAYIAEVVAADPFCQDCRSPFVHTSEIELHHVLKLAEHPHLKFDMANIRHLCAACHTIRTARGE